MSFAVPVQTLYHWLMKPMGTGQLKKNKKLLDAETFFLLCSVVILLSRCTGLVRGKCVDFFNVKSNQTAPDGSAVAGMWSEWNEGTQSQC